MFECDAKTQLKNALIKLGNVLFRPGDLIKTIIEAPN